MATPISKLKSYYIVIKLVTITGYYCTKAIILGFCKNLIKPHNYNKLIEKLIKNWAKNILKPLKINFVFNNWDIIHTLPSNKPIIFMSNHGSLLDIPILILALDKFDLNNKYKLRMLAKRELLKIPIFGKAMVSLGFPFIDRKNREQAKKDLEHAKKLMQTGTIVWAAPEGTRSTTGELLKFKKGVFIMAIETGATIVPISIKNAHNILPAKSFNISIKQTVSLTVHEPIDTVNYNLNNKEILINTVREMISKDC